MTLMSFLEFQKCLSKTFREIPQLIYATSPTVSTKTDSFQLLCSTCSEILFKVEPPSFIGLRDALRSGCTRLWCSNSAQFAHPQPHTRLLHPSPRLPPLLCEKVLLQCLQSVYWEVLSYLNPGSVLLNHLGQLTPLLLRQSFPRLARRHSLVRDCALF
jgi:hypothetical protein